MADDFKQEMLDDISGKKDDPNTISLSGIKKGEIGSPEKPARSLAEFQNIAKDKLSEANIDKTINSGPTPVTRINPEDVNRWLSVALGLLHPKKHKMYRLVLEARYKGCSYRQIALIIRDTVQTVQRLEKRAILEVKDLIAKNQTMLNNGLILNAN